MNLEIPLKTPSWNKLYAGQHWTKRKALADEWHEAVHYAVVNWYNKNEYKTFERASATYEIHFKGKRRHDFDNAMVACKLINDGLVLAGVIPDDDLKHLSCSGFKVLNGQQEDKVIVTIKEWNTAQ